MLETIHLSHLPHSLPLYVTLYSSLQNAAYLRQQLLDGNPEFEYAFLDASMILSRTHVLAACFRALNDYLNERLKSRNVHSEIVFAMSPNNNIGEAFSRFGIQTSTTSLVIIKVGGPHNTSDSVANHLHASLQGTAVAFTDENLARIHDLNQVRKVYRIPGRSRTNAAVASSGKTKQLAGAATLQEGRDEEEKRDASLELAERQRLERGILGAMALKGAT